MATYNDDTIPALDLINDELNLKVDFDENIIGYERAEKVYFICANWADFHLFIVSPTIHFISPPIIFKPELIPDSDHEYEHVYDIHDSGSILSTSKGSEVPQVGQSQAKLYNTIEKMIYLLIERLKSGGIDTETEVQVAFGGHICAQRKAFESIINLSYNVVVTNFDPGEWGERFLRIVKQNADRFGYPSETPRTNYRQTHNSGIKF